MLTRFIYIMVDGNRGSHPLGWRDGESILDSPGTPADAVLLCGLVPQNCLWHRGWAANWNNAYNRDSSLLYNLGDSQLGVDDNEDAEGEGSSWGLRLHHPHS